MKRIKNILALLLIFTLAALAGCRSETVGPEQPSDSPTEAVSQALEESESPTDAEPPEDTPTVPGTSESQPGGDVQDETASLTVDGQELNAVRHYSPLGYSIVYPEDLVTLSAWEDGDNYLAADARGTYLAVSQVEASNISKAVAIVQFENAVEDEAKGFIFGAGKYAGVRMVEEAGDLTLEFILTEKDGTIFLLERAIFTGGEEAVPLLQAMLDTFTIQ